MSADTGHTGVHLGDALLLRCVSTTHSNALNAMSLLARWIGAPEHYGYSLRLYTLLKERGLLDPSAGVF